MHIFQRKQLTTIFALSVLIMAGVAAVSHPKGTYKNLKVLPEDISEKKMDSIMESYNKALGVDCKFCHAPANFPDSLNYASDSLPMKENAREMIRMNIYINKTYFYYPKNERPEYLNSVNCMTCHRGEEYPEGAHEKR